jgi:phage tail sheath protein FI
MPFQLSPGVAVVEKDFTSIIPAVATSPGAFAGVFQWGPVLDPLIVTSENVLAERFGKPNNNVDVFSSFFTAANFLSYTNNLLVVRADTANQKNASSGGFVNSVAVTNGGSGYTAATTTVSTSAPQTVGGSQALISATISTSGTVSAIGVSAAGTGYASTPSVVIGTAWAATTAYTTGQQVFYGNNLYTVTNGGTSTTTPPTHTTGAVVAGATFTYAGFAAKATAVLSGSTVGSVSVTTNGSGYTSVPAAVVTGGGGSGATLTVTYIAGGTITAFNIVHPGSGYTAAPTILITDSGVSPGTGAIAAPTITSLTAPKIKNVSDYQTSWQDGQGNVGPWAAKFPGSLGNSIQVSMADSASYANWEFKDLFDSAPGTSSYAANLGGSNDEMHIVIIDQNGAWTGTPDAVLERYAFVSKASDARKSDGSSSYYRNVINSSSRYVWWMDHPIAANGTLHAWGRSASTAFSTMPVARGTYLIGGVDDFAATQGNYQEGFSLFSNDELYDIALIATGRVSAVTATYVINNIAEVRKDCIAFISPLDISDQSVITTTGAAGATKIVAFRDALPSTSYAVLDSGYKYQYDRYNDTYRYVPLNGDIAGICARTDYTNDPWFSPGGMNRGQVKNVVKLAYTPSKVDRDTLYKKGVNPVVAFPGQGTVLFGDKTLLAAPSAFDRINVRRLFIVLEKSVATAAKFQLFEFNDGFTRAQFKNLIEPFLRDVQGRRGITDFRVKCDDTNNTGEVIDRNEFVADIFIKPNRSINFITLNFVAARSAISFNEIGA